MVSFWNIIGVLFNCCLAVERHSLDHSEQLMVRIFWEFIRIQCNMVGLCVLIIVGE